MFNIDKGDMIDSLVSRYLVILEMDVTVTKEKIAEINALVEDGSELAMSEAKRLCEEEIARIEESGLCPMGKYDVFASDMVGAAAERLKARGQTATTAKAMLEELASPIPDPHLFVLGMFVGRIVAEAEFRQVQMAAMKQAQDMLGGMGLGGVLGALGGAVGGAVPSPKSLFDRIKRMREGGEDDN